MDQRNGLLNNPTSRVIIGLLLAFGLYLLLPLFFNAGEGDLLLGAVVDVVVIVLGLIFWLLFFSQFVLPVLTLQDRIHAAARLLYYILGLHGPAIYVENGFVRASSGEGNRSGPGVIWMDSASAAILRTRVRFSRTIGPGIHFTRADEYIAATTDLHTLSQSIGPEERDDPFTIKPTAANYSAVRERAEATTAMTRDGINIAASISITFRILSSRGEGKTRFGYNEQNAEKAIRDSLIRGVQLDQPVWNTLPARMAAELWREYLAKYRLDELFESDNPQSGTAIQFINHMIKSRLTQPEVHQLDTYGKLVFHSEFQEHEYRRLLSEKKTEAAARLPVKISSPEFLKLQEMGLEVKSVSIKKLFLAPEIEEQLVNQWSALWLKNARKEREQVEISRKLSETSGQMQGVKEFALAASRGLARQKISSPEQAVELLLESTADEIKQNPSLFKRLNHRLDLLAEIANRVSGGLPSESGDSK